MSRAAVVTGVVFVVAGLPKFVAFNWELDAFIRFGLPFPEVWVIAAGVIEIVGGGLLIARRHVLPAAFVLAMTMAVAIGVSGVKEGDVIPSLTLAPALLAACVYLLVTKSARRRVTASGAPRGPSRA